MSALVNFVCLLSKEPAKERRGESPLQISVVFCSFVLIAMCFGGCCDDSCPQNGNGNDNTSPICGNDIIETGEACDGTNLGGESCLTQGFEGGNLLCLADCSGFDTSECEGTGPECGNNIREDPEVCDGDDLDGRTCISQGFDGGNLLCRADCSGFDTSECEGTGPECGNNIREGEETCDGSDLGGQTCVIRGYDGGELQCREDCSGYDESGCYVHPPSIEWIQIAGGDFMMGDVDYDYASPVRSVSISDFYMMKTPVTVEQFGECVAEGECDPPGTDSGCHPLNSDEHEDHPVNCVTWFQTVDFCEWIGARLPSEAEWEYAARSQGQDIVYPWGDDPATCDYAVMNDPGAGGPGCGLDNTMEVCSKPDGNTDQGLCDMSGNIYEYVEDDWHNDYEGAPTDGSAWIDDPRGSDRVLRGGGYLSAEDHLHTRWRGGGGPGFQMAYHGFRCARFSP